MTKRIFILLLLACSPAFGQFNGDFTQYANLELWLTPDSTVTGVPDCGSDYSAAWVERGPNSYSMSSAVGANGVTRTCNDPITGQNVYEFGSDGDNEWFTAPNPINEVHQGSHTIILNFRIDTADPNRRMCFVDNHDELTGQTGFSIFHYSDAGLDDRFRHYVSNGTVLILDLFSAENTVLTQVWNTIVITYDNSVSIGQVAGRMWLNGTQIVTANKNAAPSAGAATDNLRFGGATGANQATRNLFNDGTKVSDFVVYSSVLDSTTVLDDIDCWFTNQFRGGASCEEAAAASGRGDAFRGKYITNRFRTSSYESDKYTQ